jgi:hypothetical protein
VNDVREVLERAATAGPPSEPELLFGRIVERSTAIRGRRRRFRYAVAAAATVVIVAVVAIVGMVEDVDRKHPAVVVDPQPTLPAPPQRYGANGLVLQDASHGPELCLGQIYSSSPPQCTGLPIANWNWAKADGHEAGGRSTWGDYHVVGTYDGTTFTLTEPPTKRRTENARLPLPDFSTPCKPPVGGWRIVDPSRVTLDDFLAIRGAIEAPPDYSASWNDSSPPLPDGIDAVFNAQYTGDLDRHRAELAKVWGGPICVSQGKTTQRALRAISDALAGDAGKELGLKVVNDFPDYRAATIAVEVVVATPELQRKVDERFGSGIVKLSSALEPVG